MLNKLKILLTKRDKQFLIGLLFFSIFISLLETVGITAIMPFISIATDFSVIESNLYYKEIYNFLGFKEEVDFVLIFGIVLIIFYVFRSGINLLYFHLLAKFSQGRYHLLAYRLFENYMGMNYHNFIKNNSSNLTKSIVNEANNLTQLISSFLFILSEIFIIILLYSMMLYINTKITILLTIILFLNALLLTKIVSKKIKKAGEIRANWQKKFYEIINRSFSNFKLIKLQSNDKEILDEFKKASYNFAKTNITNMTLSHFPRLFLEAISFGLITFIITFLVWRYQKDISDVIPIVSMFVLALYRLMPSVNRIMTNYNQILFYSKSLDIIHNDLMYDVEKLGNEDIVFNKYIDINNLSFGYEKDKLILNNINLKINKCERVAFIGESGSGKSTLVDIIIGLYKPIDGYISIDNIILNDSNIKSWRKKIGYIPQSVYLFDGNVAQNVIFGREYNKDKIIKVLKQANIYDFLESKDGIDTIVGEGGVMLSGGQKQRIAIARALYGNPEILVLDEATSALDDKTEKKIMEEIYKVSKNKTLIIIAHRLSTIDKCDTVYKLNNGKIMREDIK